MSKWDLAMSRSSLPTCEAPEKLHTRRSLGEYCDVTYLASKNYDDEVCLLMYLTQDLPTFIAGCSGSSAVELVGAPGVGEAAFYSEGVPGCHLQLEGRDRYPTGLSSSLRKGAEGCPFTSSRQHTYFEHFNQIGLFV